MAPSTLRRNAASLILVAGLVIAACGSSDGELGSAEATSVASTGLATETTAGPAATSAAPDDAAAADVLLLTLARTWEAGDWEGMGAVADDAVVATATEWYEEGGQVSLSDDNVAEVLSHCQVGAGVTTCELLYGSPDEIALIFRAGYAETGGSLRVVDLAFQGDAG